MRSATVTPVIGEALTEQSVIPAYAEMTPHNQTRP